MAKQNKKIEILIDESLCKGCDICIELCKESVFIKSDKINTLGYYIPIPVNILNCTGCIICELICPEMAVVLKKIETEN